MDLIKSQKIIANILNLSEKPERKKNHGEEERNFTMSIVITGRILLVC